MPKKKTQQTKPKPLTPSTGKHNVFIIPEWSIAAVLAFTALLYIRGLFNGFVWDDEMYIINNPYLRNFSLNGVTAIFSSVWFGNYHPLTTLAYLFEYRAFGLSPLPFHLINILVHLVNTWLVFILCKNLSGKKIVALTVALLFAVHPMHVESVAWISELKDVLYVFFILLSLIVYLEYLKQGNKLKLYAAVILLFIFSLLSKSAAVPFPVLLICTDIYKGRKLNLKAWLEKVPFLLLSLAFGILTIKTQQTDLNNLPLNYSFVERIFLLAYAVSFYIISFPFPLSLSAVHYYPDTHGGALPALYYLSALFLLLLTLLILKRTSQKKELLFGVFFFLISISVMLQIIPVGSSLTSERYTYLPYIGLFYTAGQIISAMMENKWRNAVIAVFAVFVIVFSFQTWNRTGKWKDGEILFSDVIKKYPEIGHPYWIRGNLKNGRGDLKGALFDFNKTLEYKPGFLPCLMNRGTLLNKLEDYKGALRDMNSAVAIDSSIAEAYMIRGNAYFKSGQPEPAFADCNKAIKLNPKFVEAYNNRCMLKAISGDTVGAMKDINTSIALDSNNAEAYGNRANIKVMMKDYTGAVKDFKHSLKLKDNNSQAYYNCGISRLNMKDTTGACKDWEKAAALGFKPAIKMKQQYCGKLSDF